MPRDFPHIRHALQADHGADSANRKAIGGRGIVEGSVLRSGGRVRITAQLIDGRTERHVWSGSFEEEASDVLLLQNRVARAIAAELHVALRPRQSGRSERRPKVVPEAYDSYLKGQYFFNRDQFAKAVLHFREAVQVDPDFALAHAFLYEADAMESFRQDRPISAIAATAMKRSLELDDTLAEARTDAGAVKLFWEWDWKAGETQLRRAAELDPGSVHSVSHYAMCLHILRRWDDALQEYQRILRLDPVSPRVNELLLGFLVDTGRYESAIQQFRKTIDLDPNSAGAYGIVGLAYEGMGRDAEAISAYLRADSLSGRTEERLGALRAAAGAGGLRGYRRKRLQQMEQDAAQARVPPLDLALHHVRLGETGEAMRLLEQAYEQRAPRLVWINAGARWDPLRAEERFQALLRRMDFPR